MKRTPLALTFIMALIFCFLFCGTLVQPVESQSFGTIYIKADGSVDPSTAPIRRDGDVYILTGNIKGSIVVERDNIVVDGAGYILQGTGSGSGVALTSRHNVRIKNVSIKTFHAGIAISPAWSASLGVPAGDSSNNVVSGNTITNTSCGIALAYCSSNTVSDNAIKDSTYGVWIAGGLYSEVVAEKNGVYGNTIANNEFGIFIIYASDSVLRNNRMSDNKYNFMVGGGGELGDSPQYFANDVDTSNTVDGKPVYYWVNQQGGVVPSDAGYVALIDCTGITVQNLNLTNNGQGILVYSTTNSLITKNHITNNRYDGIRLVVSQDINVTKNNITDNTNGIWMDGSSGSNIISGNNIMNNHENGMILYYSRNATIIGNTVTGNKGSGITLRSESDSNLISSNILANSTIGIQIERSANNNISGNNVTNNSDSGIRLWDSNSTIVGNNIVANGFGIRVYSCSNVVHHNSLVNNTVQAYTDGSIGRWNNGSEGNFWSDYNGKDANGDGIGDAPYLIDANNQDNYPLMHYLGFPNQQSEPFPTTLVVTSVVLVAVIVIGLLVYFRKRNH